METALKTCIPFSIGASVPIWLSFPCFYFIPPIPQQCNDVQFRCPLCITTVFLGYVVMLGSRSAEKSNNAKCKFKNVNNSIIMHSYAIMHICIYSKLNINIRFLQGRRIHLKNLAPKPKQLVCAVWVWSVYVG